MHYTDIIIYTKLSGLPLNLKLEVEDFIDYLKFKSSTPKEDTGRRQPGKAKGLISIKNNFDDPTEGFNEYMQ
ncbi:type II toxin-antitoxin system VapB family antitoxin [Perlabentimonas gracilis]|uniref:type II toxin-antitoxin system VapB family antitoxin n=1 Tax=Perlabentimonas gracilis TaxID=2715279 RepID=UPI0014082730|nr:DUF2281 domain-containing protein [Perlabentimonas gracilis]NHB67597.1 DUF2281 domain-containing protein [Perlabentimonas gracilis]